MQKRSRNCFPMWKVAQPTLGGEEAADDRCFFLYALETFWI